jgi:hypothetical protein
MANFRGTIHGVRGEASRLGHSRLEGRVAGWNVGVGLCAYREDDGTDSIGIHVDEGNGYNAGRSFSLGTVRPSENGPVWFPSRFARDMIVSLEAITANEKDNA